MAKKFDTTTIITDISLITSPVTVEMVSVTAFVSDVGLPVVLSGTRDHKRGEIEFLRKIEKTLDIQSVNAS